jgi:hypothetical protein
VAHNQEKPHTTPYHHNLIYIFTYHYIDFYIGFDGPALEYSPGRPPSHDLPGGFSFPAFGGCPLWPIANIREAYFRYIDDAQVLRDDLQDMVKVDLVFKKIFHAY